MHFINKLFRDYNICMYLLYCLMKFRSMQAVFPVILFALFQVYYRFFGVSSWTPLLNENEVVFYLYNREHLLEPLRVDKDRQDCLDLNKSLKIIIHGFFEKAKKDWCIEMMKEYLDKDDFNVILVDWSKPASSGYSLSVDNTKYVGAALGTLISELVINRLYSLSNIHIIGHSLGAHVAGYAGKEIFKLTGLQLHRITGLDPAGPLFERDSKLCKGLSREDAEIVDVIHTDGGVFGRKSALGTVDFFPNGGVGPQPGCSIKSLVTPPINYVQIATDVFCSHTKSIRYFISSINKEDFIATKCNSWEDFVHHKCNRKSTVLMGDNYDANDDTTGCFFLRTHSNYPYAMEERY